MAADLGLLLLPAPVTVALVAFASVYAVVGAATVA